MLSLFLLVVLAWSFYIGYSRGLIVQVFYSCSSLVAIWVAAVHHRGLADLFDQWIPFANATEGSITLFYDKSYLYQLKDVFYTGLAFMVVFALVYWLARFIGIFLHLFEEWSPKGPVFQIASGCLSLLVTMASLQMLLMTIAAIPSASIQHLLHQSWLAHWLISGVPLTSDFFHSIWVSAVAG